MNHQRYRQWLQLSLYGELSEQERRRLDKHLEGCPECRAELSQLQQFHTALGKKALKEPSEELLRQARRLLSARLRSEPGRHAGAIGHARTPVPAWFSLPRLALGAAAVFALGLLVGYLVLVTKLGPESNLAESVSGADTPVDEIANVRFIDPDASDGQVELAFDAVRPVRLKGHINEDRIQRLVARALTNERNPGVRLRAVSVLAGPDVSLPDPEVKAALITALRSDENPGVRKEALDALQKYPLDEEIKKAFLFVLDRDDNSGLRVAAINGLAAAKSGRKLVDAEMVRILNEKAQSDDNNYIRIRARSVLEEVQYK